MLSLTALKAEVQSDPAALGYGAPLAAGNHTAIADLLNDPAKGGTMARGPVPSYQIASLVDPADFAAIALATSREWLTFVLAAGQVDTSAPIIRQQFAALFPAGSATRTALVAFADRACSRAEKLSGIGVTITAARVAEALAA